MTARKTTKPALTFPEQKEAEWFHFGIDGKDYQLPSIHTNLSLGAKLAGRVARTGADQLAIYLEFEGHNDTDMFAAVQRLRGDQGDELMAAWLEFEGASLPE